MLKVLVDPILGIIIVGCSINEFVVADDVDDEVDMSLLMLFGTVNLLFEVTALLNDLDN